jgi:hypothetical protein
MRATLDHAANGGRSEVRECRKRPLDDRVRHAAVLGHVSDPRNEAEYDVDIRERTRKGTGSERAATEMRASRGAVARATNAPESACVGAAKKLNFRTWRSWRLGASKSPFWIATGHRKTCASFENLQL